MAHAKRSKVVSFDEHASNAAAPLIPHKPSTEAKDSVPRATATRQALEEALGVTLPPYDVVPSAASFFPQPFVGLKNLGATCYMNSLLQTLFATPELREHIISFPFENQQRHNRNVAYHLQLLFARMQELGLRNSCTTKELMDSFGMGQDAHREQHDVQELNRVLMDVLQEFIDRYNAELGSSSGGALRQIIRDLYEGILRDSIRCLGCGHTRCTRSPFLDVVLPLCSMMGEKYDEEAGIHITKLQDCLDRFVAREVISGVTCDACGGRHDVEKFQQFDEAPKMLTLQLLRMQYNLDTGRRDKVLKDIALPEALSLKSWMAETSATQQTTEYRLHAIICHRGTAYHGHYYAYVCTYPEGEGSAAQWYLFDDDAVTCVSPADMVEYLDPALWKASLDEATAPAGDASVGHCLIGLEGIVECPQPKPEAVASQPERPAFDNDLDEALFQSLFDDPTAAPASSTSPGRKKHAKVSGHVYYALYRRCDVPLYTGRERFELPPHVAAVLAPQQAARAHDIETLVSMWYVVPVSVWIGDVNEALTADYRKKQTLESGGSASKSAAESVSSYALKQIWLDADWRWDVSALLQAIVQKMGETEALMEDPWCVAAICGTPVLRSYSKNLGVMGEVFSVGTMRLSAVLPATRGAVAHFALDLEEKPAAVAECNSATASASNKWDNAFTVFVQSPDTPADFPVGLRRVVACPHGATVEDLKLCVQQYIGVEPAEQVMTAVVSGKPVLRRSGIIVGETIFVERRCYCDTLAAEDSYPLDDDDREDDLSDGAVSNKYVNHAMRFLAASYAMDVDYLWVPASAAHDDENIVRKMRSCTDPAGTLRIDRRTTLSTLKRKLLFALGKIHTNATPPKTAVSAAHRDGDLNAYQLWFDKTPGEPANLQSTNLYVHTLGAKRCCVAIVERPTLTEGRRLAEVYEMRKPISYVDPLLFLKSVAVSKETTIFEVLQDVYSEEKRSLLYTSGGDLLVRPRLLPPEKTCGFGVPMMRPIVLENATKHSPAAALRVVLERIPAPESLEKASIVLHVHWWNSMCETPAEALGEEIEIVMTKEEPASQLQYLLTDRFAVSTADIQIAPAMAYMLQSHDDVFSKVSWDALADEKVASKPIAAYPLCLEMDHILLVRSRTEPWQFVSEHVKKEGHPTLSGTATTSTSKRFNLRQANRSPAAAMTSKEQTGATSASAKKARSETGITIRAVWDAMVDEEDRAATSDGIEAGMPAPSCETLPASVCPSAEEAPEVIDFLECTSYTAATHKLLSEECRVCYAEYEEGETVCILSCHHVFHRDCLASWVKQKPTCPLCGFVVV